MTSSRTAPRPNRTTRRPDRQPHQPRQAASGRPAKASAVTQLDADLAASLRIATPAITSFEDFGLPAAVVETLGRSGITRPTPIQARTLPDVLAGRDVLGRAETGSGKTLAFGLPMLTRISADRRAATPLAPRGLVLVPTRELAQQVADALAPAAQTLALHIGVVVGGTSIGRQVDELRRGVDVLVATPGRLIDLMERRAVRLDSVQVAVLDEADHMADLGFMPAVTRILDATPDTRQGLFFSATLDQAVARLVQRYLSDPAIHAAASATASIGTMNHQVFVLDRADKIAVAAEIGSRQGRTLFFVRTKHGADRLAKQLSRLGVDSTSIHGNLNQNQRTRALDAFTSGRCRVLTATDVAARGLHVDDLDVVVHYDPPNDAKTYLHRSGRTARAGASGTVISLVETDQSRDVAAMHRAANVTPGSTRVRPGHVAVRAVADSGTGIVVTASAHPTVRNTPRNHDGGNGAGHNRRRRPSRPDRRPAQRNPR